MASLSVSLTNILNEQICYRNHWTSKPLNDLQRTADMGRMAREIVNCDCIRRVTRHSSVAA